MKRVRIVDLGEPYDKEVWLVSPYSDFTYDEEVLIVGPGDPCDWIVRATTDLERPYDLRVRVTNPDALPPQFYRALGLHIR